MSLINESLAVGFLQDEQAPDLPNTSLSIILSRLNGIQEINITTEPEKSKKLNWLEELEGFSKVNYTPTLEELLIGGLDIYNEFEL